MLCSHYIFVSWVLRFTSQEEIYVTGLSAPLCSTFLCLFSSPEPQLGVLGVGERALFSSTSVYKNFKHMAKVEEFYSEYPLATI